MAQRPELTFERLEVGRVYADHLVPVSAELIAAFCRAVDTDPPAYHHDRPPGGRVSDAVAPPSLPAMLTPPRVSVRDWRIPEGAVHVTQEWQSRRPVRAEDVLRVRIMLRDKSEREGRRRVVFDSEVRDGRGDVVATGRMTLLWPR